MKRVMLEISIIVAILAGILFAQGNIINTPLVRGTMHFSEGSWFKPTSSKIAGTDSIGGKRDTVLISSIDATDLVFVFAIKESTFVSPPSVITKADTFIVISDSTEAAEYGYFILAQ